MSLSHVLDVSLTSSNSTTIRDGITDSTTDEIFIVESTGPTVRAYNLGTGALRTNTAIATLTNPSGIAFINAASGVIMSSTASTYNLVERVSLYNQNYSGAAPLFTGPKGQQVAGNESLGIVFATNGNTGGVLTKIATGGSPTTVTLLNPDWLGGSGGSTVINATTIITKGNNWLVGTDSGQVVEIDSSATKLDGLEVVMPNQTAVKFGQALSAVSGLAAFIISGLSFSGARLAVTTSNGWLLIYDWPTKTLLYSTIISDGNDADVADSQGNCLCISASGETVVAFNQAAVTNNLIMEVDLYGHGQGVIRDIGFLDSSTRVVASGINPSTAECWILQQTATSAKIRKWLLVPRTTVNVDSRIEVPVGTPVKGRIIRLRDGGTSSVVELDTQIAAETTSLPATPNQNFIEISLHGNGINQKFHVSKYTSPSS